MAFPQTHHHCPAQQAQHVPLGLMTKQCDVRQPQPDACRLAVRVSQTRAARYFLGM
ncbi:MAG: hypothetical protein M1546_17375 [Chloroflexi bacterium]|nr:hypothetical protein [Chloroflexota bacterium]